MEQLFIGKVCHPARTKPEDASIWITNDGIEYTKNKDKTTTKVLFSEINKFEDTFWSIYINYGNNLKLEFSFTRKKKK